MALRSPATKAGGALLDELGGKTVLHVPKNKLGTAIRAIEDEARALKPRHVKRFLHINKDRDLHWSRLGFGVLGVFVAFEVEEPTQSWAQFRYQLGVTIASKHVSAAMEIHIR